MDMNKDYKKQAKALNGAVCRGEMTSIQATAALEYSMPGKTRQEYIDDLLGRGEDE